MALLVRWCRKFCWATICQFIVFVLYENSCWDDLSVLWGWQLYQSTLHIYVNIAYIYIYPYSTGLVSLGGLTLCLLIWFYIGSFCIIPHWCIYNEISWKLSTENGLPVHPLPHPTLDSQIVTKRIWLTFCRSHFQIQLIKREIMYCHSNLTKICS